jgi:hypothetical protein
LYNIFCIEEEILMKKKLLSLILTVSIVMSMVAVSLVTFNAAVDSDGRYVPSTDDTYRYYFYMPSDWENEYTTENVAGVYWWGGTDACGAVEGSSPDSPAWPGYIAQYAGKYDNGSVFYIDCPKDVGMIIWNNYVNSGTDKDADIYRKAYQTTNICSEYYDEDESELYPDGTDNFDNMIYVIDPDLTSENYEGKKTYVGEWYYYYGNGEYGTEKPAVAPTAPGSSVEPTTSVIPTASTTSVEVTNTPSYPTYDNSNKVFYFDVKSAGWVSKAETRGVFCHIWSADGTGSWPDWQSKAEKCTYDSETGIATYNIETGINRGYDSLNDIDSSNKWFIIFSTGAGNETYPILLNSNCFGDIVYCPDTSVRLENTVDSEKASIEVKWFYNNLGAKKVITSTGKVQGTDYAYGENAATIVGNYLFCYPLDSDKLTKDILKNILTELGVSAEDAYNDFLSKEEEAVSSGWKSQSVSDKEIASVKEALGLFLLSETEIYVSDCTYDGTAQQPNVKVYNNGNLFEEGKDYTLTYSNNTNVGTATVTVTFVGNYTGTVTQEFYIYKANQELIANMASTTLDYGQKSQIVALGEGKITYSSSNENVATVNDRGVVTAVSEGYTVITINASGGNNYYPDSTKLIVFVNAPEGSVKIGDINGDGDITIEDVTDIQKYIAELTDFTDSQLNAADVDGDGIVSISDATLIQKYIAGLVYSL